MEEWFGLVSEIFGPVWGLFGRSRNRQGLCDINPASAPSFLPEQRQPSLLSSVVLSWIVNSSGGLVPTIYRTSNPLDLPITLEDEAQDKECYRYLKQLCAMEDVSLMCLDFTVTEEHVRVDKELVEGGLTKDVINDNFFEYIEAMFRYCMSTRILLQLTEIILEFYDVVPEPALTVFHSIELEFIIRRPVSIDVDDWQCELRGSVREGKKEP